MTTHHTFFPASTNGYSFASMLFDRQDVSSIYITAIRFANVIPDSSVDVTSMEDLPMQLQLRFMSGMFGNSTNTCDVPSARVSPYHIGTNVVRNDEASDYTTTVCMDTSSMYADISGAIHGRYHCDMMRKDLIVSNTNVGQQCRLELTMSTFSGKRVAMLPVVEIVFTSL